MQYSNAMSDAADSGRPVCVGWDNRACEGTPHCPPRCPRFVDREGVPGLVVPLDDVECGTLVETYLDFDDDQRSMGLPPADRADVEAWVDWLADRGVNFVALQDGRPVGHAAFAPADASEPEFAVYVHQDAQGRGVGSELTRHAIARAADAGLDALVLDVARDNFAARRLYGRFGFETDDTTISQGDAVRMRLPLDRPIATRVRRPPAQR